MHDLIHRILQGASGRYIREPWRWPREGDLICELVAELGPGLLPATVPLELDLPHRLVDRHQGPRVTLRVRREVRLGTARSDDESEDVRSEGGKQRQRHEDRFDIAVFKETTVQFHLAANGPRDVVLKVRPSDVAALIEAKVYPEHYFLKGGESPWLEDVRKLHALDLPALRCVMVLDTSLPLEAAGVTWKRSPTALVAHAGLPPWPLRAVPFEVKTTIKRSPRVLRFTPGVTPKAAGTYLYAPALKAGSSWQPRLAAATDGVPHVPTDELVACCWEVVESG